MIQNEWSMCMFTFKIIIDFFEYQVMSFKLINTSVSFQVYVNSMLKDMIQEQAMTFLDDILIMKQTYKELQWNT